MPIPPSTIKQYLNEMNDICAKHKINITFSERDFMGTIVSNRWMYREENDLEHPLKEYLRKLVPSLKDTEQIFFRYFGPHILESVVDNKSIQMSTLFANHQNDSEEYKEYFRIVNSAVNPAQIEKYRDTTYVLCFTESAYDRDIWKAYTENEGVCVKFKIESIPTEKSWIWEFREIHYENTGEFEFIAEINQHFKNNYGFDIVLPSHKFAQYFKRGSYSWEKEKRICIQEEDLHFVKSDYVELFKEFPQGEMEHDWGTRKYIDIPLSNTHFKLQIEHVFLGPDFKEQDNLSLLQKLDNESIKYTKLKSTELK